MKTFNEFLTEEWGNLKPIPESILKKIRASHHLSRDSEVRKITDVEAKRLIATRGDMPFVIVDYNTPDSFVVHDYYGDKNYPIQVKIYDGNEIDFDPRSVPKWKTNIFYIGWTGTDDDVNNSRKIAKRSTDNSRAKNIKLLADDLFQSLLLKIGPEYRASMKAKHKLLGDIYYMCPPVPVGEKSTEADNDLFRHMARNKIDYPLITKLKDYYKALESDLRKKGWLNEDTVSFGEFITENWGNLSVIPADFRAALKHLSNVKLGPESRVEKLTAKQARGFFVGELDGDVTFVSFDDNGEGYLCKVNDYQSNIYRIKGGDWRDTDLEKPKFLKNLYRIHDDSNAIEKMKSRELVRGEYRERPPMINPNNVKYLSIELADAFTKDVYKKWRKKDVDLKRFTSPSGVVIVYLMDYTHLPAFNKAARELNRPTNALAQSLISYYKEIREKLGL